MDLERVIAALVHRCGRKVVIEASLLETAPPVSTIIRKDGKVELVSGNVASNHSGFGYSHN